MARKVAHSPAARCRNCGEVLHGAYCSACGQAERDGHAPTIGHFVHDLIHEFAHVDGKIFRTFGALLFEPGRLTAEYRAGRVARWIRPVRIFLVAVFLHVLISPGAGPLNHRIAVARSRSGNVSVNIASGLLDSEVIASYVPWYAQEEETAMASDQEREEFAGRFEHAYAGIRYLSVLSFALAAWLLYRRQEPYFIRHLIAGLHFYSFWYVLAAVASVPARWDAGWNNLTALASGYLFLALGRLYGERWYTRAAKTAVLYLFIHLTELGLGYGAARWIER